MGMSEFSIDTRVFYGNGALERLRAVVGKRVLVITDRYMEQSGTAARVASYLTDCEVAYFSDVIPDPTIDVVTAGLERLQEFQPEVMLAVGGGSVIDTAKAVRAFANRIEAFNMHITECFAIPTTSGTGSEVSEYAVISDAEKGIKYPLTNRKMRPPIAILDPSLTISVPPTVTADSGMDVLTHAIEAYVSKGRTDFSDAFAEKAAALTVQYLPLTYKDGNDLEARKKMHNASCMAGLAFNSAGLGLCHGISHALGGKFHIAHGRLNAMLLPHIIRYNAGVEDTANKYQNIARMLSLRATNTTIGVNQLISLIVNLNESMNIPSNLHGAGVDLSHYEDLEDEIVDGALNDTTTGSNPRTASKQDVVHILRDLLSGANPKRR
jgi:alcohol dehydrogenase class IV